MKNQPTPNAINSQEKSSYWILVGVGLLFILIVTPALINIPSEMSKGNNAILAVLLFPLAGLGMMFGGWKMRQKFFFFGPTPLVPSPAIGQIGGHLGGTIHFNQTLTQQSLKVRLSCIHTYSSGSGDNRSTQHNVLWSKESKPFPKVGAQGTDFEFCFDVPSGERPSGKHPRKGKISWEVTMEGMVSHRSFKRSWKVPAEPGNLQTSVKIPTSHSEKVHAEMRKTAEKSAELQIQSERTSEGIDLISEQGRNTGMAAFFTAFGFAFTCAGIFLFYQALQGELMLWLMAPIFTALGGLILGWGIFLLGRKLECKIINGNVHTRRSLFGRVLFTREGRLDSANQIELKKTMSSQSGTEVTQFFAIYGQVMGPDNIRKKMILAEGIEGEMAAEAIQRKIESALSSELNDELGI